MLADLHLRNLLKHILLYWHFLENLNFELNNTLECITTMFSGYAWLFSETNGSGTFKILKLELKTSKNESRKFTIFFQTNQYGKQNCNLSMYSTFFMRYELFFKEVSLYSTVHKIRNIIHLLHL